MRTTYILDTSALVTDPYAYKSFPHSDIIIPITVLNELDKVKKQNNDAGKHARVAIRLLDEIGNKGNIGEGVLWEDDVLIKVDIEYNDLKDPEYAGFGDPDYGDTQILACALKNLKLHPTKDVVFVSNDINLRVKAKSRGLVAISHESNRYSLSDLYTGSQNIRDEFLGLELQKNGSLDSKENGLNLLPNEFVSFEDNDGNVIALGRQGFDGKLRLIKKQYPWNIAAKNKEQSYAMDLVMDPNVDLVTFIGKAGTGKSLVTLAAALELVLNRNDYEKLVIYRPIQPVGNDIGYLPGSMEEKLGPWFQAILDNLEFLLTPKGKGKKNGAEWRKNLDMFQNKGQIEMEAITYIRGRSIPNAIIMVDEAQNLSKDEIKTILTRAGENTKIILTGDIEQIDNSSLDATSNGLTYVIEKFKDSGLAGHVTFVQGERSRLATKAAEIL